MRCVRVFPAAYNVHMQTVNKSLINLVLCTGILSDMLKFDKIMIHRLFKKHSYVSSSNDLKSIKDIFSSGRQVYLHISMIDN